MSEERPPFIVAEISKNWSHNRWPAKLASQEFEEVINHNHEKGYELHSFQLHRVMLDQDLNETIIAVFKRTGDE